MKYPRSKIIAVLALLFASWGAAYGATCEFCPANLWHCETSTSSNPPAGALAYDWRKASGPGGWRSDSKNGFSVRVYECNGAVTAAWVADVFLYKGPLNPGVLDFETVGDLCESFGP